MKRNLSELFQNLRLVEIRKHTYTEENLGHTYDLYIESMTNGDVIDIVVEVGADAINSYDLQGIEVPTE